MRSTRANINVDKKRTKFLPIIISTLSVLCLSLVGHSGNQASAQGAQFDMTSLAAAAKVGANLLSNSGRQVLPPVSTGSVEINTCDMPFLRSNGGNGGFPSAASGGNNVTTGGSVGSDGSGPVPAPALPPGYVGMTNSHSGDYMGYIPPGGNLYDWSRGAYGLTPGQEGEASYLWSSGQLAQGFSSGMFDGTGITMGGP